MGFVLLDVLVWRWFGLVVFAGLNCVGCCLVVCLVCLLRSVVLL